MSARDDGKESKANLFSLQFLKFGAYKYVGCIKKTHTKKKLYLSKT